MDALPERGFSLGRAERLRIRSGAFTGPTSGLAPGNVQANLVILPKALANDFLRFAQANPKPCPVLGGIGAGRADLPDAGARSRHPHRPAALPRLAAWRAGRGADRHRPCLARRPGELRDRLLVLVRGGADRGRHRGPPHRLRLQRADVPHHRSHACRRACSTGRWWCRCGRCGRRMRSARCRSPRGFPRCMARRCISACRSRSASRTSASRTMAMRCRSGPDELPVFWACGVTPQAAIAAVKPEFCITHAPGSMLITDLRNTKLAAL